MNSQKSKPVILIDGDSMVKNINGWTLSRAENVKVSGADSNDMMNLLKPILRKKPSKVILHCSTNDLGRHTTEGIVNNIKNLVNTIKSHGIQCSVSEIITRDGQLEKNVTEVKNKLKNILGKDIKIIEHANMEHLNYSKLHLNKRGTGRLAYNFIQHIKIPERRVFNSHVIDTLHNAAKIDDNSVGSYHKLKGVKIMCLNIDSLLKHLDKTKLFVEQEIPHVLGINETKLDENVSDDEIALEGYTVIRNDRNTSGGGVALFVNNDILFIKPSDLSFELESLSIKLKSQNIKPIIVTTLYHPLVNLSRFLAS